MQYDKTLHVSAHARPPGSKKAMLLDRSAPVLHVSTPQQSANCSLKTINNIVTGNVNYPIDCDTGGLQWILTLGSCLHKSCERVSERANKFLGYFTELANVLKQDVINAHAQTIFQQCSRTKVSGDLTTMLTYNLFNCT